MTGKIPKEAAEIKIDRQRCKGCGLCIENCRNKLIVWEKEVNPVRDGGVPALGGKLPVAFSNGVNNRGVRPAVFSGGECVGCAFCAYVCPESCIEVLEKNK
ncbi:MAG: 4Fe-4S dicluster domain-containing protein [Candidatus Omnitrophota bacterium]